MAQSTRAKRTRHVATPLGNRPQSSGVEIHFAKIRAWRRSDGYFTKYPPFSSHVPVDHRDAVEDERIANPK